MNKTPTDREIQEPCQNPNCFDGEIDTGGFDPLGHPIVEACNCRQTKPAKSGKKFKIGDRVKKISGSNWHGRTVGTYSTDLTPEGYAVESATEKGSVQIYPAKALELWTVEDERIAFEAWCQLNGDPRLIRIDKDEHGQYKDYLVECRWQGWLARSLNP